VLVSVTFSSFSLFLCAVKVPALGSGKGNSRRS
jgi:hypothetical protein